MATITVKSTAEHFAESPGMTAHPGAPPATGTDEDPFHDPKLRAIGIVFVVMLVAIVLLTGLVHWGVEYQNPPWNSHAYPPAITH